MSTHNICFHADNNHLELYYLNIYIPKDLLKDPFSVDMAKMYFFIRRSHQIRASDYRETEKHFLLWPRQEKVSLSMHKFIPHMQEVTSGHLLSI